MIVHIFPWTDYTDELSLKGYVSIHRLCFLSLGLYAKRHHLCVSDFTATNNEVTDSYTVTVKLTNTGNAEGMKTVKIYLQKPYTGYVIANKIEKAFVELVGYNMTKILKPNESETAPS